MTLACASLRVNVVSLVREEVLALRVSRDQGDFQELPELMDLRSNPNHVFFFEIVLYYSKSNPYTVK